MNILFASSEVAPFIKTGGLADVAGSLPQALARAGHDVKVILPLYEGIRQEWRDQMTFCCWFNVTLAWRSCYCGVFSLYKDGVTYWFVDNEYYFKRADIYGHYDDGERFAFFSRAVIETPQHMNYYPNVIHCNDWQTALVPIYLLEDRYRYPTLANARSVFTIHNIEYQGRYGAHVLSDLFGLDKSYFNEKMLAYHGDVNLMKGAIYASDFITTVSPNYAYELQYDFYAHGLAGVVTDCRSKIRGILNGIDMDVFSPETDPGLAQNFSAYDTAGKAACKAALQQAVGLNQDPDVPIVACVSRLVSHKGFDMVLNALNDLAGMNIQMVVLGTGDWKYEEAFRQFESQHQGRFAARIMYSAALSTAIYGGADIFLMPSVSEPCGLSQIIAMRYGTLPVVREAGGLKDTVQPYNEFTGEGTGFTFTNIETWELVDAVRRASDLYTYNKGAWQHLMFQAMTADFGWSRSAGEYLGIYHDITGIPRPNPGSESEPQPVEEAVIADPQDQPQPQAQETADQAPAAEEASDIPSAPAQESVSAEVSAPAEEPKAAEPAPSEEKPKRVRKAPAKKSDGQKAEAKKPAKATAKKPAAKKPAAPKARTTRKSAKANGEE